MPLTQAQYDALFEQAMQSYADRKGAHSITFGDQSITFESWDDIWRWLQTMQGQIVGRTTSRYAATSKGF